MTRKTKLTNRDNQNKKHKNGNKEAKNHDFLKPKNQSYKQIEKNKAIQVFYTNV